AESVHAVVLRRGAEGKAGPVIERLVRPGALKGEGTVTLVGVNRVALENGSLSLALFTTSEPLGTASAPVVLR
ncbi:MAG: hypothetical protein ACYC2K_16690, partial [Gemmatimonadales bacterium]